MSNPQQQQKPAQQNPQPKPEETKKPETNYSASKWQPMLSEAGFYWRRHLRDKTLFIINVFRDDGNRLMIRDGLGSQYPHEIEIGYEYQKVSPPSD